MRKLFILFTVLLAVGALNTQADIPSGIHEGGGHTPLAELRSDRKWQIISEWGRYNRVKHIEVALGDPAGTAFVVTVAGPTLNETKIYRVAYVGQGECQETVYVGKANSKEKMLYRDFSTSAECQDHHNRIQLSKEEIVGRSMPHKSMLFQGFKRSSGIDAVITED